MPTLVGSIMEEGREEGEGRGRGKVKEKVRKIINHKTIITP